MTTTAVRPAMKKAVSMKVPLMDVAAQQKPIRAELNKAVTRVLESGHYILGPEGAAFEAEFAKAHAAQFCLGVSSGTHALHLALAAFGVGPGDEVITTANSFVASASCISYTGARPVFADIDPVTLNIDPADIERRITPKTRGIIPVHLFGYPADMDPILEIARKHNLFVIEDCAQAHLAEYKGKPIGALGDIGCFSFYPSKNLGAAGDAGAVTTNFPELDETMRVWRDLGRPKGKRYEHVNAGFNYRLDDVQAAVLRVKLKRLKAWTAARRKLAAQYRRLLAGLPLTLPPEETNGTKHSYHLFVIQAEQRDALARHLTERGVANGVYYPMSIPAQPVYAKQGYRASEYPVTESVCRKALAIPIFETMSQAQLKYVANAIKEFYQGR